MFYRFQTFKDDSFPSTAISNQNRALHITLHSPLNRNDPSFWSSQIAVDSHFVCVCGVFVYVCLPAPSHCPLSSGAQSRTETRLWHAAGLRPCAFLSLALWCLVLPGSKRLTEHPLRGFPPLLFLLHRFFTCRRYSAGGRGRTVTDQAAMNMAFIGDADPFTASIPATKVELTVSCR